MESCRFSRSRPLDEAATICELQKMYFLPETRGLGIGSQVMAVCLQSAKDLIRKLLSGNDAFMHDAQKLYKKWV
jgi:putative acetyltransferase